jgi:hypothetical protein
MWLCRHGDQSSQPDFPSYLFALGSSLKNKDNGTFFHRVLQSLNDLMYAKKICGLNHKLHYCCFPSWFKFPLSSPGCLESHSVAHDVCLRKPQNLILACQLYLREAWKNDHGADCFSWICPPIPQSLQSLSFCHGMNRTSSTNTPGRTSIENSIIPHLRSSI